MSTSSTSITIKWANSTLAEILRKKEEEAAKLSSRGPRIEDPEQSRKPRGRRPEWAPPSPTVRSSQQRWTAPIDLSKPTPLKDRPRSANGATSFHFAVSKISKETPPTFNGKLLAGYSFGTNSPGADHELYIGRELATELQAGGFDAYLAREAAVERDAGLGREPGELDDDDIDEGLNTLDLATDTAGVPSIFSNISDDPFERAEFWKAVHRCERTSRVQQITIFPNKNPDLIARIIHDEEIDPTFREAARLAQQSNATRDWMANDKIPPQVWKGTAEQCGKVLMRLKTYPDYTERDSGIVYKSGAGGAVQHRLVAELPHELTAAERAQLVRRFCHHLETIEKGKNGETRGLMYTAAIHAPDAHNDPRNFHLHIVFHDRPARLIEGMGMWDFEIAEAFERRWEIRTSYPYRQKKLRLVRSADEGDDPAISGQNFIPALRREFSKITNEALERAGIERRYDPRTYKAMGIDRTPTDHLGTKAASLEAAGVATQVGTLNAAKIWADAQYDIVRYTAQRKDAIAKREAIIEQVMTDARGVSGVANPLADVKAALTAWREHAINLVEDRELVEQFDLMEEKARSRAEKVRATCLRTLADIDIGTARKSDVKAKPKIEKRLAEASEWLREIDIALGAGRTDIEYARGKVKADEEREAVLSDTLDLRLRQLLAYLEDVRERETQAAEKAKAEKAAKEAKAAEAAKRAEAERTAKTAHKVHGSEDLLPWQIEARRKAAVAAADNIFAEITGTPSAPKADRPVNQAGLDASPTADKIAQPTPTQPKQAVPPARPTPSVQSPVSSQPVITPTQPAPSVQSPPNKAAEPAKTAPSIPAAKGVERVADTARISPPSTGTPNKQSAPPAQPAQPAVTNDKPVPIVQREASQQVQPPPQMSPTPILTAPMPQIPVPQMPVTQMPVSQTPVPPVVTQPSLSPPEPPKPVAAPAVSPPSDKQIASTPASDTTQSPIQPVTTDTRSPEKNIAAQTAPADDAIKAPPTRTPTASPAGPGGQPTPPVTPIVVPPSKPKTVPDEQEQPALFDLPEKIVPAKVGSPEERQRQLDDLIARISKDTLLIFPVKGSEGELTVPSLSEEERALLASPEQARRTQARLAAIKNMQDLSVDRITSWLKIHGADESKIKIQDRTVTAGDAPKAVITLMAKYKTHPTIRTQLDQAADTQEKISRVIAWIRSEGRNPESMIVGDGIVRFPPGNEDAKKAVHEVKQYAPVVQALNDERSRRIAEGDRPPSEQELQKAYKPIPLDCINNSLVHRFIAELNSGQNPESLDKLGLQILNHKYAREELYALGRNASVALIRATNQRPNSKGISCERTLGR